MGPLLWFLDEIIVPNIHSFHLLDEWYSREFHSFMEDVFHDGVKFHRGNITQFTKEDYRLNTTKESKNNWRQSMAKRLFGIRCAAARRFTALNRYADSTLKNPFAANDYWLACNCRPACGKWHVQNPNHNPRNPTGKPCEHRFCPWCYIRRFEYISRLISAAPCIQLKDTRGRIVNGIGPHLTINVVTYDVLGDHQDQHFTRYLTHLRSSFLQVKQAKRHVKQLLGSTGQMVGIVHVPLYDEDSDTQLQVGSRVAILHTGDIDKNNIGDHGITDVFNNIELHEAIQFAMPYPVDFLRSDRFVAVKHQLAELFSGTYSFTKITN